MRSIVFIAVVVLVVAVAGWSCAGPRQTVDSPAATAPAATAPAVATMQPYTQKIPGTELQFDMVPIPSGTFTMGSPDGEAKRRPDEGPQFDLVIEPFYMGKFEVTWDLYNEYLQQYDVLATGRQKRVPFERLADAVSYPSPIYDIEFGPKLQRMGGRGGRYPAVLSSHFAAKQFTKWLSAKTSRFYRLPTEAEWEYAARGGATTAYFFGDDPKQLGDYAWYFDNAELPDGEVGYRKVGQKKPNPFGLHDIYGNIAEIVIDQYDKSAYQAHQGKRLHWRDVVRWPDRIYPRVARGGDYESEPEHCRSASRQVITIRANWMDKERPKGAWWWTDGLTIGFRVVSPMKTPSRDEQHQFWDAESAELRETLKAREHRAELQLMEDLAPPSSRPAVPAQPFPPTTRQP